MSPDSGAGALAACPHCGLKHPESKLKCPETDMLLPLAGRLLHDKFRFLEPIGRGGMAEVWLARNELVDREVALKLIRPEVARHEENVARFRSEAKAAGRIGSPNICDILDFGHSAIGPFIVMERLRGVSLGEVLRAQKKLPVQQAVLAIREALVGLSAAHRAGIIHRDLKPENIFLHRPEGGDPVVKLMDFGVSKFTDGGAELETEQGVLLGTPEYMAPEQCKGARHADARTDVWAMGAILYRALAGVDAFHGPSLAATLMMVATDEPKPLGELVEGIDPNLVAVVNRCLLKDPEDRFQTAEDLYKALAPFDTLDRDAVWAELVGVSTTLTGLASAPTQVKTPQPSEVVTTPHVKDPEIDTETRVAEEVGGERKSPLFAVAALLGLSILVGGIWFAISGGDEAGPDTVAVVDEPDGDEQDDAPGPAPEPAATSTTVAPTQASPDEDETATGSETGTGEGSAEPAPNRPPPAQPIESDEPSTSGGKPPPDAEPPKDPAGVVRAESWVTPTETPKTMDHRAARHHCEGLAESRHLGIGGWKLSNPTVAKKFIGAKGLKGGRYWTSALHKGKARAIRLPSGKIGPLTATKSARPLCIARWP